MAEEPRDSGSLGKGIGLGVAFTIGGVFLLGMFAGLLSGLLGGTAGFFLLFGIGLTQGIWMLPAYLAFSNRGATETAKGIVVVAGIVFLLNASCWGLLMGGKFRIGG